MFGVGTSLQRGIAFLLLPIYTSALVPEQYGPLSVLLAVSAAAGILFSLGLDLGLFRSFFLLSHDPARQRRFLLSVWKFLIVLPLIAAVILAAAVAPLMSSIRNVDGFDVGLALVAGALYAASTAVPLVVMRVEQRLRGFMALSLTNAVASTGLTLLFVVVIHGGIKGWLCAAVLTNVSVLAASAVAVPWQRGVAFEWPMVREAVRFGSTLLPHAFALWALLLADRGVLAGLVSSRQLGIYSLAATLGVPVMIAVQSLNQAFMPAYTKAGLDAAQRPSLEQVVVHQIAIVVAICLGGALLGGPLVSVMAAPAYHTAAPLVAWIALGYGFLGLYFVPMNGVTLGAGRSSFVWSVSAVGAASNIALLVIFVPSGGIRAAAIASAGAYLVLLVGISVYARGAENPVRYRWARIVPILVCGSATYLGAVLTTPGSGLTSIAPRLAWFAAFGAAAYAVASRSTRTVGRFNRLKP